jgi:hypothetical protein
VTKRRSDLENHEAALLPQSTKWHLEQHETFCQFLHHRHRPFLRARRDRYLINNAKNKGLYSLTDNAAKEESILAHMM